MDLLFVTEARFYETSDKRIFGDFAFNEAMWSRYLEVFDRLVIMARLEEVRAIPNDKAEINNDKISFISIPYFVGPVQFILKLGAIKTAFSSTFPSHSAHAFIFRVPGFLGHFAAGECVSRRFKYAVEVVGDPAEVFEQGSFRHPLRFFFRWMFIRFLKWDVRKADWVLYVTKNTLQKKYPADTKAFKTFASNVSLPSILSSQSPKEYREKKTYQLLSVGTLEQMYKGPDILLRAIQLINSKSLNYSCQLIWLGDGKYLSDMVELSVQLGISDCVSFKGNVSSDIVFQYMKAADMYVHAARTEGLPRVIVEAMASGLPCVSSRVGGIPELLNEEVLVEKNNPELLAERIIELLSDSKKYNSASIRNLDKAADYRPEILAHRRRLFYKKIAREN